MARTSLQQAIDEVAARDPVLAGLVARVGPVRHQPRDPEGPFAALVRAIVYQQLAGAAARTIHGRVHAAVGRPLTPESLNGVSDADLRAAGLSANKLASLRDLSAKVLDGTVVLTRTSRRGDEELIERLTSVRGIGRWTAQMHLMFQLRRLDVWPTGDLGVRRRLVPRERADTGWAAMTDSELAVARLVAQGLTNREVAEQLFVSPHTVSSHLRSIFAKLDINSRLALARIAAEHETTTTP